jgi:hypothetical protein
VLEWREQLQKTERGRAAALGALARLWHIDSEQEKFDAECPRSGAISCIALEQASIADLERYNVAVVVALHTDAAAPRYVVLKKINEKHAQIVFDGRDWDLSKSEFMSLWRGDAVMLVSAPVAKLPLQPGASDALIAWFDTQLFRHFHRGERRWQREIYDRSAELADNAAKAAWLSGHYLALREQPPTSIYDAKLMVEVKRFQQEQHLPDNGVIDLATLVALNRTANVLTPSLSGEVEKQGS